VAAEESQSPKYDVDDILVVNPHARIFFGLSALDREGEGTRSAASKDACRPPRAPSFTTAVGSELVILESVVTPIPSVAASNEGSRTRNFGGESVVACTVNRKLTAHIRHEGDDYPHLIEFGVASHETAEFVVNLMKLIKAVPVPGEPPPIRE
jgi:hypothetical protein